MTTSYPASLDTAATLPSAPRPMEDAVLALEAKVGVPTVASASGALTIQAGSVYVTKAGVAALTLAAPTAAQAGTRITIISNTANAHTLTAAGLIDDGVTGGSKTTATFAAFAGASIILEAYGLKWNVISKNAVTIT